MGNLLEIKIKNGKNSMSKREIEISNYVLKEKPDFEKLSITKLASNIEVSPSAINRWCYKMGFDGYKDFISVIKMKRNFDNNYSGLISTTSKDILYSVATTEASFKYSDLILVIDKIKSKGEIILYGESFTFLQCEYFARMFKKINIKTSVINVASDISLILPNEDAVHIFVSMSGKNPNIIRAVGKIAPESSKTFIVSVCSNKKSNLSETSNAELHGSFFQSINIDNYELPIVAHSITEYILKQLFIHVYMENKESNEKLIKLIAKKKYI